MKKITDEIIMNKLLDFMKNTDNDFCKTLVADLTDYRENGFLHAMVFLHQQNAEDFKNAFIGTYFYKLFVEMFDVRETGNELVCYRGDTHSAMNNSIFHDVKSGDSVFKSFTTSYDVAKRFAEKKAEDTGETGIIYTCIPHKYLDCAPYGVVDDEAEIFIYSPRQMISVVSI